MFQTWREENFWMCDIINTQSHIVAADKIVEWRGMNLGEGNKSKMVADKIEVWKKN